MRSSLWQRSSSYGGWKLLAEEGWVILTGWFSRTHAKRPTSWACEISAPSRRSCVRGSYREMYRVAGELAGLGDLLSRRGANCAPDECDREGYAVTGEVTLNSRNECERTRFGRWWLRVTFGDSGSNAIRPSGPR